MSLIKILPENLVNQIAAGEVIERPASVVKELLENSIDAGADKITLEIQGAGDELVKITDNGCGMDKEDAKLAFERHATSKISDKEDLFNISSFGFRGEAIASIASVSFVTMKTKRKEDASGTLVVCAGGKIEKYEDCTSPDGTQIEIKNLFFNTPARKKYLKTPSTEYQHILSIFQGIALMHPETHFKLIHDEKASFEYPKVNELIERVRDVLGKNTSENCLPVFYGGNDIKLDGFVGKPELARSGSKHQYLYVNGRQINHPLFGHAVAESFHSLLMDGRKPFYFINIEIDPELIDVNVHPRKLEVRFQNQSQLFSIIKNATAKTLEKNVLMPNMRFMRGFNTPTDNQVKAAFEFTEKISGGDYLPGRLNKYSYAKEEEDDLTMIPLTQIARSYILAENSEGLILVDQHAAHERVKYEELMDQFEKESPEKQQLLLPLDIELSASEVEIFQNNKEIFEKLGFEIEAFGGNTFNIHSVPVSIAGENMQTVLQQVLSDISEDKQTRAVINPKEKIIEYIACRSAIKFGKELSLDEMAALIRQVDKLKRPYTCPHGRPSMVKLSYYDLEKMFGRK